MKVGVGMNITIINTTDKILTKKDVLFQDINIVNTKSLDIKYCQGCFDCWTKTPGLCIQKDEMPIILQSMMNSDLTVYITDVTVGFVSSELKKIMDKSIPLIHPYFDIKHEELHHLARYDHFPKMGLVLLGNESISDAVYEIINKWYTRVSHNMGTTVSFVIKDDVMLGGLQDEINRY